MLRGPHGWVGGFDERGGAGSENLRVSLASPIAQAGITWNVSDETQTFKPSSRHIKNLLKANWSRVYKTVGPLGLVAQQKNGLDVKVVHTLFESLA